MAKSNFGILGRITRAKCKLVSAFRKIVPRRPPEEEPRWEVHSETLEPGSQIFSYVPTPPSAYNPRNPAVPSASGSFIPHFDPTQEVFWPEPVDSPPRSNVYQHQNLRWLGARYEDGSSVAWNTSTSDGSWETVDETSDSVMSSLLRGLPDIPRPAPPLRRRPGRSNLRSLNTPNQQVSGPIFTPCNVGRDQNKIAAAPPGLESEAETQHDDDNPDRNHRPQVSVSEAVQVQIFTPSAPAGSPDPPGPTIRGTPSSVASSRGTLSSRPSPTSLVHRPQNPMVRTFAQGSNVLDDPFVATPAQAGTSATPNGPTSRLRWSDFSSSEESLPSPVYQGNGRYLLHDGTIYQITSADPRRRPERDASHADIGSFQTTAEEVSSDEANSADTSDPHSPERSPPPSPAIAIRQLDRAVQNLERFASPSDEAMQELAVSIEVVVEVVDSLVRDVEIHAYNAEQRRRRLVDRAQELAEAHAMIRERDEEINRLLNPEVYGERRTPPTYSSDAQEGESTVQTPSEPQTALRNTRYAQTLSSPTPGADVADEGSHFSLDTHDSGAEEQAEEVSRWSDDTDDSDTSSVRLSSEEANAGSAPPSYGNLSENQTSLQSFTQETVVRESPPSAAESDNTMLVRTPRNRNRSL